MLERLTAPLVEDLRAVLGEDLLALYLTGSAVTGDWHSAISDVDLVAVVEPPVDELDMAALDQVHRRWVSRNPDREDRLEIVYVSRSTLASGGRGDAQVAVISPGEDFHLTRPVSDWLQNWYLLRQSGIALVGSPPTDVVGEISSAEFVRAARAYLAYLAAKPLETHSATGLAYAVLSTCRALYTIETGGQLSKEKAAAWLARRTPQWADVCRTAVAVRAGAAETEAVWQDRAIEFVRSSAASATEQQPDPWADQAVSAKKNRQVARGG